MQPRSTSRTPRDEKTNNSPQRTQRIAFHTNHDSKVAEVGNPTDKPFEPGMKFPVCALGCALAMAACDPGYSVVASVPLVAPVDSVCLREALAELTGDSVRYASFEPLKSSCARSVRRRMGAPKS